MYRVYRYTEYPQYWPSEATVYVDSAPGTVEEYVTDNNGTPTLVGNYIGTVTYPTFASFPTVGRTNRLYINGATNILYRWTGSAYVSVGGTSSSLSGTAPVSYNSTTGAISMAAATTSVDGYLTAVDWTTFNTAYTDRNKWDGGATGLVAVTGRTSLGASTVGGNLFTLINPNAITFIRINADNTVSTLDASTFRTAIGAGTSSTNGTVTSVSLLTIGTAGADLTSTVANGTTTPVITLNVPTASASNRGVLSPTDWSAFTAKQAALNGTGFVKITGTAISYDNSTYLTTISGITAGGELTGTYASPSLVNSAVIGKVLTGVNITGGTISATDSILIAFGKVQNQINGLIGGSTYQGTWNASTNTPTLTSSVGTKGYYYVVSVTGSTNLNGITDWKIGDWAIFNGTTWDKVDNTDAVVSVNGETGAVSLTTTNINEGTNLYFTNARTIVSTLTGYTSGAGTIASTDTILSAIQKLNGNIGSIVSGVSSVFGRTGPVVATEGDYSLTQLSDVAITSPSTNQVLKYNGTGWVNSTDSGLTSVGVSMPSAFSVSSSPLIANGTIAITGAGDSLQYIDGTGALQTFPTLLSSDSLVKLVRNQSGATMNAGTIVYISGATGNKPLISKALATGDSTSAQTYGLLQTNIANNADGYIVVIGNVNNLDTSALTEGQQLYLSGTTAGTWTTTKPYAPIHLVYIGIVLRSHPTQGIVGVKIQNGYEMDELHNVDAHSPSNNDILSYNTTTNLWEHKQIATTLGYTPIALTSLSGTAPISYASGTGAISITQSGTASNGYLSSTDWNAFNNKQAALTNPVTGTGTINEIAYFNATGSTIGSLSTGTYPSLAELAYVKGVSSSIQTQLGGKQATITGAATTITSSNLTVSKALVSDPSGKVATSTVSSIELSYVAGVTSAIQTQLNAKLSSISGIAASGDLTGTYPSPTIASGVVKLDNMSKISAYSIIGNNTGALETPTVLSGANVTAMLSTFNGTSQGLVPVNSAGVSVYYFLASDGSWQKIGTSAIADQATDTIIANISGLSASPSAIAISDLTPKLTTLVGDSGSGGTKGLVPAPAVGDAAAGKFLKADGLWAVPTTTIGTNVVTNAMLAQVATATFKGRTTPSTGNVEDLTVTQATAMLNVFSSTLKGLAPASGGGTTNFLRADGTWAVPAGGGGGGGTTTNPLIVKADSGTTEGTDLYTFDGSSAKTINIVAGTNITITKTAGTLTISSTGGSSSAVSSDHPVTLMTAFLNYT